MQVTSLVTQLNNNRFDFINKRTHMLHKANSVFLITCANKTRRHDLFDMRAVETGHEDFLLRDVRPVEQLTPEVVVERDGVVELLDDGSEAVVAQREAPDVDAVREHDLHVGA